MEVQPDIGESRCQRGRGPVQAAASGLLAPDRADGGGWARPACAVRALRPVVRCSLCGCELSHDTLPSLPARAHRQARPARALRKQVVSLEHRDRDPGEVEVRHREGEAGGLYSMMAFAQSSSCTIFRPERRKSRYSIAFSIFRPKLWCIQAGVT